MAGVHGVGTLEPCEGGLARLVVRSLLHSFSAFVDEPSLLVAPTDI